MPAGLATALSLVFCLLHACGLAWLLVLSVALLGHAWIGAQQGPARIPAPQEMRHAG